MQRIPPLGDGTALNPLPCSCCVVWGYPCKGRDAVAEVRFGSCQHPIKVT